MDYCVSISAAMNSKEIIECTLVGNEQHYINTKKLHVEKKIIADLIEEEVKFYEEQNRALKILQDALKKKDKVLIKKKRKQTLRGKRKMIFDDMLCNIDRSS